MHFKSMADSHVKFEPPTNLIEPSSPDAVRQELERRTSYPVPNTRCIVLSFETRVFKHKNEKLGRIDTLGPDPLGQLTGALRQVGQVIAFHKTRFSSCTTGIRFRLALHPGVEHNK
jgi:hypothetical protein